MKHRRRIAVPFWPPVDPEGYVEKYGWERWPGQKATRASGERFDDLSIVEYVDVDEHGRYAITEGEVITL